MKLMATISLNRTNFDQVVSGKGIVLVDFWAPWCKPCHMFSPVFELVSERHEDKIFGKVNTDEERELTARFRILSIPTLIVFKDGMQVFRHSGLLPQQALEELLRQVEALDMEKLRAEIERERLVRGEDISSEDD